MSRARQQADSTQSPPLRAGLVRTLWRTGRVFSLAGNGGVEPPADFGPRRAMWHLVEEASGGASFSLRPVLQPGSGRVKSALSEDGGAREDGGGRLRGAGACAFGGDSAWLWAITEAGGQRKKRASHLCPWGDLTDAQRLHHRFPLKNCDDFCNMRSILDYGSFQYRLKKSLPFFLYDLLRLALRVL
jgi:hypothetical protein